MICLGVGAYYAGLMITFKALSKKLLVVINFLYLTMGICAVIFGFYLLRHTDLYADSSYVPFMFFVVGWFLSAVSIIGLCGVSGNSKSWLQAYMFLIGLVLIVLIVCGIVSAVYVSQLSKEFDDMSEVCLGMFV